MRILIPKSFTEDKIVEAIELFYTKNDMPVLTSATFGLRYTTIFGIDFTGVMLCHFFCAIKRDVAIKSQGR